MGCVGCVCWRVSLTGTPGSEIAPDRLEQVEMEHYLRSPLLCAALSFSFPFHPSLSLVSADLHLLQMSAQLLPMVGISWV